MVTALLVDKKIEAARALLGKLKDNGLPISSAFWNYLAEPEQWTLMIASPLVDSEGPLAVYARVDEAVPNDVRNDDLSLRDIAGRCVEGSSPHSW